MNSGVMKCLVSMAAFGAFAVVLAQPIQSLSFQTRGVHRATASYEFPVSPPGMGTWNWWGRAEAATAAHNAAPDDKFKVAPKLTYSKVSPTLPGVWTPGSVNSGPAISIGDGCAAVGFSQLLGDVSTHGVWPFDSMTCVAESRFFASIGIADHDDAFARYSGFTFDPWAFGRDGFVNTPDAIDFDFWLPETQDWPLVMPNGNWSATFIAKIADIATYDVDAFHNMDPALVYSVSFGANDKGLWTAVKLGNPEGFPMTFDDTAAGYEQALLHKLESGWVGGLPVLKGKLDFHGTSKPENLTFGFADSARANLAPEPISLIVVSGAVAGLLVRRPKRNIRQQ